MCFGVPIAKAELTKTTKGKSNSKATSPRNTLELRDRGGLRKALEMLKDFFHSQERRASTNIQPLGWIPSPPCGGKTIALFLVNRTVSFINDDQIEMP